MDEIMYVSVTYAEVINNYISKLLQNTSQQIIKNILSDTKGWCDTFGLNEDSPVGAEFNKNFKNSLAAYAEAQRKAGKKESTVASRLSRIKKLRAFYLDLVKDSLILPARFDQRLSLLMNAAGLSVSALVKDHLKGKIAQNNLTSWLKGNSIPKKENLSIVVEIEQILNVLPNTLTSCLPLIIIHEKQQSSSKEVEPTINSKKNSSSSATYTFRLWNVSLHGEFQELTDFKISPFIPEELLCDEDRKKTKGEKKSVWTRSKLGEIPAADITKTYLSSFYGFLILPANSDDPMFDGMGMNESALTLALLSDKELVERYVLVFRKSRAGGKFNHGHLSFLSFVSSLLRPGSGFLYLRQDFAEKIGLKISIQQWRQRCEEARDRILKIRAVIEEAKNTSSRDFAMGRDPFQRIRQIVDLQNPLSATMLVIKLMKQEAEKLYSKPAQQAVLYRDILLFSLIQSYPLRIITYSFMCFDEHLVKAANGIWWLKLTRDCFKNRRFLTEDYNVPLSFEVGLLIEEYKTKFRPLLTGADKCKYVFLSDPSNTPSEEDFRLQPNTLSTVIFHRTEQFIPDCEGFRGHSFRHIIVTEILKNDPSGGINLAAKMLNDSPRTVQKYYAYLQTSHYVAPYNEIFSWYWKNAVEGADDGPPPANGFNQRRVVNE